jgi:hypothetical protein
LPILIKKAVPVPKKLPGSEEYVWEKFDLGYRVIFPDNDFAELHPLGPKWGMKTNLGGVNFSGIRPSLEIAFKVVDRLIWVNKKDVWSKIRPRVVLNEFQGDLSQVEFEETYDQYKDYSG